MEPQIVTLTPKAIEQAQKIFESEEKGPEFGLRLGVIGGGCSGLSYKIDFDRPKETDKTYKIDELTIIIDIKSSVYLRGTTLDYKDGLDGKGFVFINPNASNTCGCGESFSV